MMPRSGFAALLLCCAGVSVVYGSCRDPHRTIAFVTWPSSIGTPPFSSKAES
jgi:hypothetical protein